MIMLAFLAEILYLCGVNHVQNIFTLIRATSKLTCKKEETKENNKQKTI